MRRRRTAGHDTHACRPDDLDVSNIGRCLLIELYLLALFTSLLTLVLLAGTVIGWLAARNGTARDGDLALAIFVGYAIGQWLPMAY